MISARQPLHDLRGHGVTNAGLVRCGVERLPFGGGPRFFFWVVMGPVERPMCYLDWFGTFTSNLIAASCSGHAVFAETEASVDPSGYS